MNILPLIILCTIGGILWWRSGVVPTRKYFLVGIVIMFLLWWGIWGQVAVFDQWWVYNSRNTAGFYIGVIPAADILYFIAGLGWYLYFSRKLDLF